MKRQAGGSSIGKLAASASSDIGDYRPAVRPHNALSQERLAHIPWWAWVGGIIGAVYIMSMLLVAERLGAAFFLGRTVTAAIVTSLMLDHFDLVGFPRHPAGAWRSLGAALMISGLSLIATF